MAEKSDKNIVDVVVKIASDRVEKEQIVLQYKEALALLGYSGKVLRIPALENVESKTHKEKVKRLKKIIREVLNESFSEIDPRKLTGNYMSIYNTLWARKERFEKKGRMKIEDEEYDVIILTIILELAKKNLNRIKKIKEIERRK